MPQSNIAAIIVAAGRGSRAGVGGPKQYRMLAGKTVLERTIRALIAHDQIDFVRVVIHRDDYNLYGNAVRTLAEHPKLRTPVTGGADRQASVRLGLESLVVESPPEYVIIHDAARPFVGKETITRVINALDQHQGAIAALPIHDTIKRADDNECIEKTQSRHALWRAQTPQAFHFTPILQAHQALKEKVFTDDAAVAEEAGLSVALIRGEPDNMKITQAEDFGMAHTLLERKQPIMEFRTGQGFDVHAFDSGSSVTLCGVEIIHDRKLKGHSDADVGMHALTDAILGALGAGDIGDHFSPSDPQWRGAPSHIFLAKARNLTVEKDGRIVHCDVTIICEAPKIAPYRDDMRTFLSNLLQIDRSRISVKATTTEGLGFTGREEGIAAMATATIALPQGETI